jgi:DMATS type aromatic prenyltransferase
MRRACDALGWSQAHQAVVLSQFRELLEPWGSRPIGAAPARSFISNDEMPIELAFAWTRHGNEVRAYFDPLGEAPTAQSRQAAGVALTRRLGSQPGASLQQYLAVEDLFIVPDPSELFAIWTGVLWRPGKSPWFKVFLNPQVHGRERSAAVVEEAMRRLGLDQQWAAFRRHLGNPDFADPASELGIFCLDLRDPADARVRVYVSHAGATAARLEHVAAGAGNYQAGQVARVCRDITGHAGPYLGKPTMTTVAFGSGAPTPTAVTMDIPLDPNFDNDAVVRDRVSAVLRKDGIDPTGYRATVQALADRPLTMSCMQSWFAYRPGPESRTAVYFATDAYERVPR